MAGSEVTSKPHLTPLYAVGWGVQEAPLAPLRNPAKSFLSPQPSWGCPRAPQLG